MLNTFLIDNFFEKNCFSEKTVKTVLGHIWRFFRERRRLAPKSNNFFYHKLGLEVFSKKAVFSKKTAKNRFRGSSLFSREGGIRRRKWIYLFLWEMRFWIFFHVTIFSKKATFFKKMEKKSFWGTWPFFRRVILS